MNGRTTVTSLAVLHIILVGAVSASAQSVAKRTTAQSYERLGTVTPVKTTTVNAEPALQLRLTRKYAFSPAYVQSIVRVSPHPDNRLLRITLDSPNFYRSSDIELEGADAARSHFFSWKSLPAGRYDIVVTIFGPEGPRGQSSEVLEVIGGPIIPQ